MHRLLGLTLLFLPGCLLGGSALGTADAGSEAGPVPTLEAGAPDLSSDASGPTPSTGTTTYDIVSAGTRPLAPSELRVDGHHVTGAAVLATEGSLDGPYCVRSVDRTEIDIVLEDTKATGTLTYRREWSGSSDCPKSDVTVDIVSGTRASSTDDWDMKKTDHYEGTHVSILESQSYINIAMASGTFTLLARKR